MNTSNISQNEIKTLEQKVSSVVVRRLKKDNLPYKVKVMVYDEVFTTGVQGDKRTYCPLVEITLLKNGETIYDEKFAHKIATEIINKVIGTNRIVITIPN